MNTSALMRTASAAVFAVLAVFGAFADDPVYITGAEYVIDGNRLTVTSGQGELVLQIPDTISSICVTNGASLKICIDNPFAKTPNLYLYGKKRETAGCVTHIHLGGFLLKDQPRQWHQGRSRHHGCLNGRSEWR